MLKGEAPVPDSSRLGPAGDPALTPRCCPHLFPAEATERRFLGLLGPWLSEGTGRRLVAEAFHCALKGPMVVDEKTLVELHGFQAVSACGGESWPSRGIC